LLVNTKGKLRATIKIGGVDSRSEIPAGYTFFGVALESDPVFTSSECRVATGVVKLVRLEDGKPSAVFGGNIAWQFMLVSNSAACAEADRGEVVVRDVSLLAPTLGAGKTPVIAAGTLRGRYEQPGAICPAGGIELSVKQPGMTTEPESEAGASEVDNGEEGKNVPERSAEMVAQRRRRHLEGLRNGIARAWKRILSERRAPPGGSINTDNGGQET
jgi:hypothetical protein